MSAGQIAYKLCDRDFECEACPLDAALRGQGHTAAAPAERIQGPGASAPEFPDDRVYAAGHTWAGVLDNHLVRVGLDAFAASLLVHASGVVLPAPGSTVEKGRTAFWITDGSSTVALNSPVAGAVLRRNPRLREHPALAAEAPYEDGWLIEVACEDPRAATSGLDPAPLARERAVADSARLREAAIDAVRSEAEDAVGPTLLDGGEATTDLMRVLGSARYYAIVGRLLG
jgi:glycine cleavage system H protein